VNLPPFPTKPVAHVRCCELCGAVLDDDQSEHAFCENCEHTERVRAHECVLLDKRQKTLEGV
jgi:uncharacterized paraquat-inducible protein A